MKREILFRGKRVDNGEWVQGSLIYDEISDTTAIVTYVNLSGNTGQVIDLSEINCYTVITETVESYTGLTDKNGNRIFEGDIIEHECGERHEVIFNVKDACVGTYYGKKFYYIHVFDLSQFEVVGNVCDNPELLK